MLRDTTRPISFAWPLLMALLVSAAPANASYISAWIPFELRNGHVTLPVTLNGKASTAILDTGAFGNGIAKSFLIQNEGKYSEGRSMVIRGVFGREKIRLVNDIDVGLLGASFKMGQLIPMSLGQHGFLIGLPFFEKFVVQLDYPNKRMRIATRDVLDLKKFANVKMRRAKGAKPVVEIDFNKEFSTWITFDTGNSGGFAMRRIDAERFDWLERYPLKESRAKGVTGQVRTLDEFVLPTIGLGPFTLEDVRVSVPKANQQTNIGKQSANTGGSKLKKTQSAGLLGFDVLQHFVVTIDFKRSLLHLEPGDILLE